MNFQQLRSVREAVRCGFNLTEVAATLHTSQPGVSRQVRELEEELGVELFVRSGKRLLGLTSAGQALLPIVERVLLDADSLRRAGQELQGREEGRLSVAATHSQARYALPHAVRDFRQRWPRVTLHLHQGSPKQVAEMLISGEADIGIATEALAGYEQLVTLPCYRWSHILVAPRGHPLDNAVPITLARLAEWPLITYDTAFTGRSRINRAFERVGVQPNVALTALDADVIKTYVSLGLGLGIISALAFDAQRDAGLVAVDAAHLFESNTTRLALRRGTYLRRHDFDLIALFAPHLSQRVVEKAMQGGGAEYQL